MKMKHKTIIALALPIIGEVAILVRLGGRAWTRLDPSQELLEGSG